jgi:hypothetical protein
MEAFRGLPGLARWLPTVVLRMPCSHPPSWCDPIPQTDSMLDSYGLACFGGHHYERLMFEVLKTTCLTPPAVMVTW